MKGAVCCQKFVCSHFLRLEEAATHMIVHKIVGILLLLIIYYNYNNYYFIYRESHYTISIVHKIVL